MAGAIFVVSDKGEILSPKKAPEITAAAVIAAGKPIPLPTAIRAIPTVAIDVKEVPVLVETTAVIKAAKGRKTEGLIICKP